ncbi:MAG: serine hydrolase [Pseudomonadota bacterium]
MRNVLAATILTLSSACAGGSGAVAPLNSLDEEIDAVVADLDLAGAALAVAVGDELIYAGAAGCAHFDDAPDQPCARPLKAETNMRVASISKLAVALVAHQMTDEGLIDLDADVSAGLGRTLRHPDYPDRAITLRQLLSHTSSIRDPEQYWIPAPKTFDVLLDDPAIFAESEAGADRGPGAYFTYANLNTSIVARVLERASGMRFDELMSARLFEPLEIDAGFNWSGVSTQARRNGATLYRRENDRWAAQVDDTEMLAGSDPVFLAEPSVDRDAFLDAYQPGDNPTLFSPQGGLRASVFDLVAVLDELRAAPGAAAPVWALRSEADNGETEGGFYKAYGAGAHRLLNPRFAPGAEETDYIGHGGEAYGLRSGAWLSRAGDDDPANDVRIAYAITGGADLSSSKTDISGFAAAEVALMRLAIKAAETSATETAHAHHNDDPRPFDEKRDAGADVDAALRAASQSGKRVLLVMGGNWCHDSRGLAAKFENPVLSAVLSDAYELVWVDVGYRDRNLDIAKRFGVNELNGTPTILILSRDGTLLNAESVHDWKTADSIPIDETLAYFEAFAPGRER